MPSLQETIRTGFSYDYANLAIVKTSHKAYMNRSSDIPNSLNSIIGSNDEIQEHYYSYCSDDNEASGRGRRPPLVMPSTKLISAIGILDDIRPSPLNIKEDVIITDDHVDSKKSPPELGPHLGTKSIKSASPIIRRRVNMNSPEQKSRKKSETVKNPNVLTKKLSKSGGYDVFTPLVRKSSRANIKTKRDKFSVLARQHTFSMMYDENERIGLFDLPLKDLEEMDKNENGYQIERKPSGFKASRANSINTLSGISKKQLKLIEWSLKLSEFEPRKLPCLNVTANFASQ
jgi:hypothetical protein